MSIKDSKSKGSLEVICGPMFSGKSEELIRRLRRATFAKQGILVFKHALDDRHTIEQVRSHNGSTIDAFATDRLDDICAQVYNTKADVIGIDEVQFYPQGIITVICELVDAGKRVIVGGLDRDFRGIPFGPMPTLLAIADNITKLTAICTTCGREAYFSQRLVGNKPAKFDDPVIQVGAQETYQARCRNCYSIDRRPNLAEFSF
ncbi:MAG TPA: thymidine kinase [Candidatus Dependentiae bacterium]|nr:thymidine kinase [Candidatus Dependentiae bacterium]HRQ62233.1 thymidine kinase [Candidatus Dependentiae bacterium]